LIATALADSTPVPCARFAIHGHGTETPVRFSLSCLRRCRPTPGRGSLYGARWWAIEALDAADTIVARDSLEKMAAHQLAAVHSCTMKMIARLNEDLDSCRVIHPQAREAANIRANRAAGSVARLMGAYQSGMLALQRKRSGGQQHVKVTHVHPAGEGCPAIEERRAASCGRFSVSFVNTTGQHERDQAYRLSWVAAPGQLRRARSRPAYKWPRQAPRLSGSHQRPGRAHSACRTAARDCTLVSLQFPAGMSTPPVQDRGHRRQRADAIAWTLRRLASARVRIARGFPSPAYRIQRGRRFVRLPGSCRRPQPRLRLARSGCRARESSPSQQPP
jgi:hypothetical protein